MIKVVKNKNFIEVYLDGKAVPYKLDINTGIVYGLRGTAIKSVKREVFEGFCPCSWERNDVQSIIYNATDWGCCSHLMNLRKYADILKIADSFDNLGISASGSGYNLTQSYRQMLADKKLRRDYIKYATESKTLGRSYSYSEFQQLRKREQAKARFDFDITDAKYDRVQDILLNLAEWATDRQIKCFCVNFIYNNFYLTLAENQYYRRTIMTDDFKNYCKICEYLEEKVTTKDNFLSEYGRLYKAYMAQKEEIDTRRFREAMDIHRAEMEFEYGDFKVVIPTCPQDIKDEGRNMHHCVANYAYRVMELQDTHRPHIVFVRHKDTPDKCYITCEIKNGKICQYYLSHDRRISTDEDKMFKMAYQKHLDEHWQREYNQY